MRKLKWYEAGIFGGLLALVGYIPVSNALDSIFPRRERILQKRDMVVSSSPIKPYGDKPQVPLEQEIQYFSEESMKKASAPQEERILQIRMQPSPHYTQGRTKNIEHIVIHSTEGSTAEGALSHMRKARVSSHYIIDENGSILQLVDDKNTAWHVGPKANSMTIGIELVGFAYRPSFNFSEKQYETIAVLCSYLLDKHNLCSKQIVPHKYITHEYGGTTHEDPGPNFDWRKFYTKLREYERKRIIMQKKNNP